MSNEHVRTPWTDLNEEGDGLTVDAFITTLMSQVGNALRRTITVLNRVPASAARTSNLRGSFAAETPRVS